MRVLTYCVTAAPGAAQTLRRGFAGHITCPRSAANRTMAKCSHVTAQAGLLVSLAFDRFRGSADQLVRRTTTFFRELAPR